MRNKGGVWSDKVYWQVADSRRRPSGKIDSSRSTQLGKEDFYFVVIVPTDKFAWMEEVIGELTLISAERSSVLRT